MPLGRPRSGNMRKRSGRFLWHRAMTGTVMAVLLAFPCRTGEAQVASSLNPPATREAWEDQAVQLRAAWWRILGTGPGRPPGLRLESHEIEFDGVIWRARISYNVLADTRAEAFLLWKAGLRERSAPGVLVFHSTNPAAAEQPAGRADRTSHHLGLLLARAGFVILAPRCYIFEPGRSYAANTDLLLRRFPRWTGMGRMLWDGMRAVDVLADNPLVDPTRIGAAGHSLGAKEVLYLAAFDRRVKATVFSEGGIGLRFSNWDAPWYLGAQINAPEFNHDHDELLALVAPRPFLLIGGDAADGERSRPYIERAKRVYDLYGRGDYLRFLNHRKGHSLPEEARDAMLGFLEEMLGRRGSASRD